MFKFLKGLWNSQKGVIDPFFGTALKVGTGLLGTGVTGVGAGISGGQAAEEERKRREQEQENIEAQLLQQRLESERAQGLQGIGILAELRGRGLKQFGRQPFKDALASLGRRNV